MATHIDPRPYSSSEVRRVERFAKKQPTTLVFEDRNRVPIEDDDDSTGADADGGFDDDDEFDYPDIPVTVDEDVESDFGDESYSPSEDDDHGGDEELIADSSSSDDSAAASDMDETSSAADLSTTGCSYVVYCFLTSYSNRLPPGRDRVGTSGRGLHRTLT